MNRVKDASEGGIEAATVPGVGALLRAHIPKHDALKQQCLWAAESLGCASLNREAGLSCCAIFPILLLGSVRCQRPARGLVPTEISPVNVSVDLVPQPFTNSLVAHSDYFDRPQNVAFRGAEACSEA